MTVTWTMQGGTPTEIDATDVLRFAGGAFATKVEVSSYQTSTHVRLDGGTDKTDGDTPTNVTYIASGTGDWGDGTEAMADILDAECSLKINLADAASVAITSHTLYSYDGSTTTAVPTGVTFQAAESGDAAWTNAEGSAAALTITDSAASISHDFYVSVSASPESVGLKSAFSIRNEFTYS